MNTLCTGPQTHSLTIMSNDSEINQLWQESWQTFYSVTLQFPLWSVQCFMNWQWRGPVKKHPVQDEPTKGFTHWLVRLPPLQKRLKNFHQFFAGCDVLKASLLKEGLKGHLIPKLLLQQGLKLLGIILYSCQLVHSIVHVVVDRNDYVGFGGGDGAWNLWHRIWRF